MRRTETSIVFTGDIGFDRYMDRKWEDEDLLSREVLEFSTVRTIPAPMWRVL